jgi:outer membrane receptor protein involved in Fe transport
MKKQSILLFIFIVFAISSYAQEMPNREGGRGNGMGEELKKLTTNTTGVIVGSVIDEKTNTPLEYCTIVVLNPKDSSIKGGGITNETGRFQVKDIPWGTYILKVNFIGYKAFWIPNIEVSKEKPIKFVGKIKLKTASQTLETVEVTAKKEMIQTNLDKKVFNVDQILTSTGGSAIDALQNIPSVQVDIDGNVSIRGSGNITILIDGRPSNMTLEQIPSASIESIEVITNPSARFDPDGMSGILNVILKKKKEHGFNGMVSANVGAGNLNPYWYFGKNSFNANLNYRYDKLNITASFDNRTMSNHFTNTADRTVIQNSTQLLQNTIGGFSGQFRNYKLGADYFFNKKNSVAISGTYGSRSHGDNFFTNNITNQNENIIQKYTQTSKSTDDNGSYEFSGNYKKTFDTKGKEWTIDAFYSNNRGDDTSFVTKNNLIPYDTISYQQNNTNDKRRTFTTQTDFITPIGNGGRLETGAKFSNKVFDSDYKLYNGPSEDNLILDNTQNNKFNYNENLYAAYAIYSNSIWTKLKYQFGLRYEFAQTTSDLKSQNLVFNKYYSNPFPSAHIRYEFSEANAFQISYSRRVSRPSIHALNPFVDYRDSLNLSKGNPFLNPEFVDSYELSHYLIYKGTSLSTTAFFRQRNDIITRFTTLQDSVTTMTTYANINKSTSYGLEFVIGQTITKWWKLTGTGSYYRTLYSDLTLDNSLTDDYSWNLRMTSQMNFGKIGDLQITFNYRSPMLTIGTMGFGSHGVGQGQMKENYNIDLGSKINVIKDKLAITIRVSDIFNWWKMDATSTGEGFYSHTTRTRESRAIWFGLSYKFNDYKAKREKKSGSGDDSGEDM